MGDGVILTCGVPITNLTFSADSSITGLRISSSNFPETEGDHAHKTSLPRVDGAWQTPAAGTSSVAEQATGDMEDKGQRWRAGNEECCRLSGCHAVGLPQATLRSAAASSLLQPGHCMPNLSHINNHHRIHCGLLKAATALQRLRTTWSLLHAISDWRHHLVLPARTVQRGWHSATRRQHHGECHPPGASALTDGTTATLSAVWCSSSLASLRLCQCRDGWHQTGDAAVCDPGWQKHLRAAMRTQVWRHREWLPTGRLRRIPDLSMTALNAQQLYDWAFRTPAFLCLIGCSNDCTGWRCLG